MAGPDEDKNKGETKYLDPERFSEDPVQFGFLMGFEYGDEEESKAAEKQIFDEPLIRDWEIHGKDILSIGQLRQIHPESKGRYLLYHNESPFSVYTANLLHQIDLEFSMKQLDMKSVRAGIGKRSPLPVLVDRKEGWPWDPTNVRDFARTYVLGKIGAERPRIDSSFANGREVTTFDTEGKISYRGHVDGSPLPIKEELDRVRYKDWYDVAEWDLGPFEGLLKKRGPYNELVVPQAYLAIFFDEVEQLKKEGRIVLSLSSSEYHVAITTTFLKEDRAYKFEAAIMD